MKKAILGFVVIAGCLCFASCSNATKCKCTIKVGNVELKNQVIEKPEDVKCAEIKVEDIKGEIVNIDLSKVGTIDCVTYHE